MRPITSLRPTVRPPIGAARSCSCDDAETWDRLDGRETCDRGRRQRQKAPRQLHAPQLPAWVAGCIKAVRIEHPSGGWCSTIPSTAPTRSTPASSAARPVRPWCGRLGALRGRQRGRQVSPRRRGLGAVTDFRSTLEGLKVDVFGPRPSRPLSWTTGATWTARRSIRALAAPRHAGPPPTVGASPAP